jgi:hypothetical protein
VLSEGEIGITLGIVAIVVAIVMPFVIERWKRPHLIISRNEDKPVPGEPTRFLHCTLTNRPHLHALRWIERNAAYDTTVTLTFYKDGNRIFNPLQTKWTNAPECRRPIALINQLPEHRVESKLVDAFDGTMTVFAHTRTIPACIEGQPFDIIVKNQGVDECYAFNGWSYDFPNLSNPNFLIPIGKYTVEIKAVSNNARSDVTTFVLKNPSSNVRDIQLESVC